MIGPPPWLLDSFDMLGFGYQRAESIQGTKGLDVFMVMDERMLSREVKTSRANTALHKYFVVLMEVFKCIVHRLKTVQIYDIALGNIDKVDQGSQGLNHF